MPTPPIVDSIVVDERTLEAALETAQSCRRMSSIYRQMGFAELARYLAENSRKAERWYVKAIKKGPVN